jgi:signal peptidase I
MNFLNKLWRDQRGFLVFMGLMFVFRSAIADWNYVPSSSMNPNLLQGDRVAINKLAYSLRVPFSLTHIAVWGAPQPGDVITFDSPRDEVNLIKRVVAVAGDVVEMHNNTLTINGQTVTRTLVAYSRLVPTEAGLMDEQIWHEQLGSAGFDVARLPAHNNFRDFQAVRVPQGKLMVMGDNRDNSNDSRFIGFIDVWRVTGRAERVVLSHDPKSIYLPRSNRWWLPLHS